MRATLLKSHDSLRPYKNALVAATAAYAAIEIRTLILRDIGKNTHGSPRAQPRGFFYHCHKAPNPDDTNLKLSGGRNI